MRSTQSRPRLVFFQYRYDTNLPEFLLAHKRDHVKCLSQFFDVIVIQHDCDYRQVCDTYEPDLALFEGGVNHATCRRARITNICACPHVPKLGLHNADAFCNARSGFLSDMDHWGIETFFAISTTTAEHTPEIADQLFTWPNCIDPEIYRDYGEWKSIPVLFSGNSNSLYPWRKAILRLVSERYPSLICPHPGYNPGAAAVQVLAGERYARMINASFMAPACGTVAREVVRKHFEIPACKSCLVTERSAGLEAAGFVDMQNCVFADESDVLDKLRYLFDNPAELQRITERGYELVHSEHTLRQRGQIFQWYTLSRALQPSQTIVQKNPFGPLTIDETPAGIGTRHVRGEGLHLAILREGDRLLADGKYHDAEASYMKCTTYMRWMPEPKLKIALCRLFRGDAKAAHARLSEQIQFILAEYAAIDPDPVEWAYYVVSLLCLGRVQEATKAASEFSDLCHPELQRVRRVIALLNGDESAYRLSPEASQRRTIHQLPNREWGEWLSQILAMLRACGKDGLAAKLRLAAERPGVTNGSDEDGGQSPMRREPRTPDGVPVKAHGYGFAAGASARLFKRRLRRQRAVGVVKDVVAGHLHRFEARYGYWLPYHLSEIKRDEFFVELRALGKREDIKTVLLIGVPRTNAVAEALLAGISDNDTMPEVCCIDRVTYRFRRFEKRFAGRIQCHGVPSSSSGEFLASVATAVDEIEEQKQRDMWDAIVMSSAVVSGHDGHDVNAIDLRRAGLVVLDGLDNTYSCGTFERLLNACEYRLVADNPYLRNGYAVFCKRKAGDRSYEECTGESGRVGDASFRDDSHYRERGTTRGLLAERTLDSPWAVK